MARKTMKQRTPGPWRFVGEGILQGADDKEIDLARLFDEPDARLIAMAPEMAWYLAQMKCCYKAPEVADETCGHCIVCRAKAVGARTGW